MNINGKVIGLSAVLCVFLILQQLPCRAKYLSKNDQDTSVSVPIGGNAWRLDKDTIGGNISNDGIVNWTNKNAVFITYVRFAKKGNFKLYLNLKVPNGETVLSVSAFK